MQIILNNASMVPIYEQLIGQIRSRILEGELKPDAPLPSVRALAAELRISALTVKKAYDLLEAEGYVVTVHGKGTYVGAPNLEMAMEQRRKKVEDTLAEAIAGAKIAGMAEGEVREILEILLEENYPDHGGRL